MDPSAILSTEFSESFVQGMRDRMVMGYHNYGPIKDAYPHKVNALETMRKRLRKYEVTGNTEFLIDAANMLMIEFMLPSHPSANFRPTDSSESPGRAAYDTFFEGTQKANHELTSEEFDAIRAGREAKP